MSGWTIVKAICTALLVALFGMLYWSSTLLESDLKQLRGEIKRLNSEISCLKQKALQTTHTSSKKKVHTISSDFPNLLEADSYYETTLPRQLGPNFEPHGTLQLGILGRPENLHPFNGFRDVSILYQNCTVKVAELKFGHYETLAPDMAIRLEARPQKENPEAQEYWVFLRDDVYWQPLDPALFPSNVELAPHFLEKHPVTAYDFLFFYNALMNPNVSEPKAASLRTYFGDIEEFTVIDDFTFVVRWKAPPPEKKVKYSSLGLTGELQPLPCFVYQYFADGQKIIEEESDPNVYRTDSVWAQNFSEHWSKNIIVSCGPYLFEGMSDEGISLKRNPDFFLPYRALVEGIYYCFKESYEALWQAFKAGHLDLINLSPNQLLELDTFFKSSEYLSQAAGGEAINNLDFVDLSYIYIGWNNAKPLFADKAARQAMTLAIDRKRIIEQNLNDMGIEINGPFARYSAAYDASIPFWPYNPEEAAARLEALGWSDLDGDGILDKVIDGKRVPLRFTLLYYVKSQSAKMIVEYISTALKEIGVDCQLGGVDLADLSRQFDDKGFDALMMGWKLGAPPEDPRQLWYSTGAKEKGSSNAIGFQNKKIDQIIDKLNYEYDKQERIRLYHQFDQIIHKEAPYTFLYTPKVRLLYRERVKNLFIPMERQDLIPGADVPEPSTRVVWLEKTRS